MTDFLTPSGFVRCLQEIRTAGRPLHLYFQPKTYSCTTSYLRLRRSQGIRVGEFDALVLGAELPRIARLQLGIVIERAEVSRETSKLNRRSMTYYKAQARS